MVRTHTQSSLFKILADDKRCELLALLSRAKKAIPVGDIAEALDMTPSAVSHQLGKLHALGIVAYKRDGREIRYCLRKTPLVRKIARLLAVAV